MDLIEYEKIKAKYGTMGSWAIWSEQGENIKSNMGDISFFENPTMTTLNSLNPNIILVGLNISKHILKLFSNFHPDYSSAQDYKTRYALKNTMRQVKQNRRFCLIKEIFDFFCPL